MRLVTPPGYTLKDMLEERKMSQATLARVMRRPLKTINEIIKGKAAIIPETAIGLEAVLGVDAEFWLIREALFRLSLARKTIIKPGRFR
jgi:HTH-type transcriptional regulator / antitoxin HigA